MSNTLKLSHFVPPALLNHESNTCKSCLLASNSNGAPANASLTIILSANKVQLNLSKAARQK